MKWETGGRDALCCLPGLRADSRNMTRGFHAYQAIHHAIVTGARFIELWLDDLRDIWEHEAILQANRVGSADLFALRKEPCA